METPAKPGKCWNTAKNRIARTTLLPDHYFPARFHRPFVAGRVGVAIVVLDDIRARLSSRYHGEFVRRDRVSASDGTSNCRSRWGGLSFDVANGRRTRRSRRGGGVGGRRSGRHAVVR